MPRTSPIEAVADCFGPGERVFLAGASGEATALVEALMAQPERTRGLDLTTSFVPGINPIDPARLHPTARLTGLFMQPSLRAAQRNGRFRHLAASYAGFTRLLRERLRFDTCVVQVAPPGPDGRCSLGPAVEFMPEVVRRSARVIGVVNQAVPALPGAPTLDPAGFAMLCEADGPLRTYAVGEPDATALAIARTVAGFIGDGAALQIGLGKIPSALLRLLAGRRGLRLHSGMLSDGIMDLAAGGVLDVSWRHATCVLVGSATLYAWAAGRPDIHVMGCGDTHDPRVLAGIEGFIAVNSALEVDLFGQCNLEVAGGRVVSGPGGGPDFSAAAARAPGGLSMVALPASFDGGRQSRIRARLDPNGVASLARTDVDVVVTEHGAADLRGRSVHERAEALIAVAAPGLRAGLQQEWQALRNAL